MQPNHALALWESVRVFGAAFREQQEIVREVDRLAREIVIPLADTPPEFSVDMDPAGQAPLSLRRNLFSTLFLSTYHVLGLRPERRRLYGTLNQLFRIWVTGADNLLDGEDKVTLPLRMPGQSRIMRQVVAIMAADRILARVLREAAARGVITDAEAAVLSDASLQVLLPSAAQEATEEGGITSRPPPEYVLQTVHRLKTGLLFHLPFLGPERIEPQVDRRRLAALKQALLSFGIGCQILDDIRDMARDWREQRHNYILSLLAAQADPYEQSLRQHCPDIEARLYHDVPHVVVPAARLAMQKLCAGLQAFEQEGLDLRHAPAHALAGVMLETLDLSDLCHAI